MKVLSIIFYQSYFGVFGNLAHPWDKFWTVHNGSSLEEYPQEAKKHKHNSSDPSNLNDYIFSTKNLPSFRLSYMLHSIFTGHVHTFTPGPQLY